MSQVTTYYGNILKICPIHICVIYRYLWHIFKQWTFSGLLTRFFQQESTDQWVTYYFKTSVPTYLPRSCTVLLQYTVLSGKPGLNGRCWLVKKKSIFCRNSTRLRSLNHTVTIIKLHLINLNTVHITSLDFSRENEYTYITQVKVLTGIILLNSKFKIPGTRSNGVI